ncbi:hypothetical protein AC578_2025 [Pseudocercospora eumusae]|uniref:DUF1753-domain-containing protein n=1 Tax=Pseudocercospora eumusae TaxID=321146 RepID=A0A139HH68_9PEZI|nr:hypothetical protein AC578_2025 [Pseudocercospora eumusae]
MAHTTILRFPKPRSLLHFISLRTAAEFINLTLIFNKVTGLYGVLAIFTGYHLNPLQISHYIYSLLVLALVTWLMPSIRRPDHPLRNVALAYVYGLDAVINSVYTALFGTAWFMVLTKVIQEPGLENPLRGPAGSMDETAGFTDPEVNVSNVEVVAKPASGILSGQEAVAYGHTYETGGLGGAVLQSDSMTSIALLALFTLVRIYFCIVVMSYARSMLRQYVAQTSNSNLNYSTDTADPTMAPSPFASDRLEGSGWQGKLGRILLRFPSKRYWLGREDESPTEWERATSGRFESGRSKLRIKVPENGVGERERRARSGTGPPLPKKADA